MIIQKIKIHNFFIFEDVDVELGEDIFFITGENRDDNLSGSNGSGKSLFCQSIIWCLFDDLLRKGLKKDDVIGSWDEYAMVQIVLSKGEDVIEISRYRKHPKFKNKVFVKINGSDLSRHTDGNEYIVSILDINHKSVYHGAYLDPDTPSFASLTPSSMLKVVSEILDMEKFDPVLKALKKKISEDSQALLWVATTTETLTAEIVRLEEDLWKNEQMINSLEETEQVRLSKLRQDIFQGELERKELLSLLEGAEEVKEQHRLLQQEMLGYEELRSRFKRNAADIERLEAKKRRLQEKLTKERAAASNLDEAYDNIYHNQTGVCSYCGNFLNDSKHLGKISEQLQQEKDQSRFKIIDIEVVMSTVSADLKSKIAQNEIVEQDLEKNIDSFSKLNSLQEKISTFKEVEALIAGLDRNIAILQSQLQDRSSDEKERLWIRQGELNRRKQATEDKREESKEDNQRLTDSKLCSQRLVQVIKDSKKALMTSFLGSFKDVIDKNLDLLTEGDFSCGIEWSEKNIQLVFSSSNGKTMPYHMFSRGERAKINTSVSTALNELLSIGFLINDEPLGGVDDAGIVPILEFYIKTSRNKTLLFCGHQQVFKDVFSNKKNIHIVKHNNCSTVEVF